MWPSTNHMLQTMTINNQHQHNDHIRSHDKSWLSHDITAYGAIPDYCSSHISTTQRQWKHVVDDPRTAWDRAMAVKTEHGTSGRPSRIASLGLRLDSTLHSATSLMWTPLVPSKVFWIKRRPYSGGFKYIFSRCGNVYLCPWSLWRCILELLSTYEEMFQISPCMLERKADPRLEHQCYYMYNVQFLSQSALSDNLVCEACQQPHYPVNFAQYRYQKDRKTCPLNIV